MTTEHLHTVAVSLPGTPSRVLVEHLHGTPAEAQRLAKELVWNFAAVAPIRWATEVVDTRPITDVPTHPERD